jgi:hypothetical protein
MSSTRTPASGPAEAGLGRDIGQETRRKEGKRVTVVSVAEKAPRMALFERAVLKKKNNKGSQR